MLRNPVHTADTALSHFAEHAPADLAAAVDKAQRRAALALDMTVCFTQPAMPGIVDEVLATFRDRCRR